MALLAVIAALATLAREPAADDLAAARQRVETLYAAGSLPEALAAARDELRGHGDDPILLRRTCQLALTLRAPELAREPADRLADLVRERKGIEPAALAAWKTEADALEIEVAGLEARERAVRAATVRARIVSLATIGLLGIALVAFAKRSRPLP
jgi:hypothetical protein